MDTKQIEAKLYLIEQKIEDKIKEGCKLLSRYKNTELNKKELWKVNFQIDSLEIDIGLLRNKSNRIKKLQDRLNTIDIELTSKNMTLLQLQNSKKYYGDLLKKNMSEESNKIFQDYLNDISTNLGNIINEIKNLGIKEVEIKRQLSALIK